jgi:hypothetical protein
MKNVKEIELLNSAGEIVKHIVIDNGDGSFTTMFKSTYDELQAEQSTPSL